MCVLWRDIKLVNHAWELGHMESHSVTNKSGRLVPSGAVGARMCLLSRKLMRQKPKAG